MSQFVISPNFQTPPVVCDYMASLVPSGTATILEPTPGLGGLVSVLRKQADVVAPVGDFWQHRHDITYDCVVMNPPFTPMSEGFRYLSACMELSHDIIALLPWFILINSERRMRAIEAFGLVSVTHLPRKTFPGCRIQCCVLQMKRGYQECTEFKTFDW